MSRARALLSRPTTHDEVFVSSLCRFGESDCIARLFSKSKGRFSAFYKNGLTSAKRRIGVIQAPSFARASYLEQNNAMRRLVSCDLASHSFNPAQSLKAFAYANYLAELIEQLLPEEEPAIRVFLSLEQAWLALLNNGPRAEILRAFELKLLDYCGYLPEWPDEYETSDLNYNPQSGRFVRTDQGVGFVFSKKAVELARALLECDVGEYRSEAHEELMMIGRIFVSRLRVLGINNLKSVIFLKEINNYLDH